MTGKGKQNHIFQKSKSYEIYIYIYIYYTYIHTYIYIYIYIGEDQKLIQVFYWCIPLDNEIYTKCKKTSNLIKDISSHNICAGIKSQQVRKTICHSVPKTFDFS